MRPACSAVVAIFICSRPVLAQSFNIDMGSLAGTPSSGFAAVGLPGYWNDRPTSEYPQPPLRDLRGATTEVYLHRLPRRHYTVDNAGTTGEMESLLDDFCLAGTDAASEWLFVGLQNGDYEVVVYAWHPTDPAITAEVGVSGLDLSQWQRVGGEWPGAFVENTTHAIVPARVEDGTLTVYCFGGLAYTSVINAIQIIFMGDCNGNGVPDDEEITVELAPDCDENWILDECEMDDCNGNGVLDICDVQSGHANDCNGNLAPDTCDVALGSSGDEDETGVPDECEVTVLFVDAGSSGANLGTNWSNAYTDLSDALRTAGTGRNPVKEVWVAGGVYTPAPDGENQAASFGLAAGVAVYGGFRGNETERDQRNPKANLTLLTGDLAGDDGQIGENSLDNSYHVLTAEDLALPAVLDGFSITGGHADYDPVSSRESGGGMNVIDGRVAVANCRFTGNYGSRGGAIHVTRGEVSFSRCTFTDNVAGSGGAIDNVESTLTFEDCLFLANSARSRGGAINCRQGSLSGVRSMFIGNRLQRWSGQCQGGGAVATDQANARFRNCLFSGNVCDCKGGAVYHVDYRVDGSAQLFHGCTFSLNVAQTCGGVYSATGDWTRISNSILWGNIDDSGSVLSAQILGGHLLVSFSCIEGWEVQGARFGNIGADPLLIDPDGHDDTAGTSDDNPRLAFGSPAIDSGGPGAEHQCNERDLDGIPRVLCARIDMGAFEFGFGDADCNGHTNLDDYGFWLDCAVDPLKPGCESLDSNADCSLTLRDFGAFQVAFERQQ